MARRLIDRHRRHVQKYCKEVKEKMDEEMKEQIQVVLEDSSEGMRAAAEENSDLDEGDKQMNRELVKRHEEILAKLGRGESLSLEDFRVMRDANEIHVNDSANLHGRHAEAIVLEKWLDQRMAWSREEATPDEVVKASFDGEGKCPKCGSRVSFADVTDTVVFVGDEIVKRYAGDITNRNCVRCTYPKQYPEYEDYDRGQE